MNDQSTTSYSSIFSMGFSLGLVFIVLFIALVQKNLDLALPAGGMLIMGIGTRLWSRASLFRLDISINMSADRLFPGDDLGLRVKLENRKMLPIIAGLEFQSPALLDNENQDTLRGETRLLSFEKSERRWKLRAKKRGLASLGDIRISSGDILGLHKREKLITHPGEIIIYPQRGELQPLNIPFQEFFGINASKGPVEDPAWYAGTRDYSGNRPARNIHWKASARLGKLQEKLYEPTSHRKVLLVLDLSDFKLFEEEETLEHLVTSVGTLAAVLMETGASFGLVTNAVLSGDSGGVLPIGRGPEHLGKLLEILARIEHRETDNILPLLKTLDRGDLGLVYCAARKSDIIADNLSDLLPRRRRLLFVFSFIPEKAEELSSSTGLVEPVFWMDFPAYLAGEIVHVG
jgi:uncharacterized protein (DUF58 family)